MAQRNRYDPQPTNARNSGFAVALCNAEEHWRSTFVPDGEAQTGVKK